MAAPALLRPQVSDLQFEAKTGKTAEGWPLEQIKAGGLPGLCAYAGFYATRKKRPALVRDQTLGLDPLFTSIFWTLWPGFCSAEDLSSTLIARARSALAADETTVAVTACDALAEAIDPRHNYVSYLRPAQQAQLLAAARTVLRLVEGAASPPFSEVLSAAADDLRARVRECSAYLEFISSQAGATAGAPAAPPLSSVAPSPHTSLEATPAALGGAGSSSTIWTAASPSVIAAQWTHAEHHLFRAIPVAEWITAGWDKPRYEHASDCTRRFIDHFNATALWVTAEVLAPPTAEERAVAITRFIQVGTHLLHLNNFSGVVEISMGLRREACARLRASWALVPQAAKDRLAAIFELADDKRNYANYKAAIRALAVGAPVVPHLGAHTSELSVQEQLLQPHTPAPGGGPEYIHFRRYRELVGIIGKLISMQQRGYGPSLPAFSPATCNLLAGTVRPFFFQFDEDREAAVARLDTRSRQAEPDAAQLSAGPSERSGSGGGQAAKATNL